MPDTPMEALRRLVKRLRCRHAWVVVWTGNAGAAHHRCDLCGKNHYYDEIPEVR